MANGKGAAEGNGGATGDVASRLPSRWQGPCALPDWWANSGSRGGGGGGAVALPPLGPQGAQRGPLEEEEEAAVERWASTPWAATFDLATVPYLVDAKLLVKHRQLQVGARCQGDD